MADARPRSTKEMAAALATLHLRGFLDAGGTLDLTPAERPAVSVLMLTCNRAEVTLSCLRSLAAGLTRTPFEVVVVDNASTDDTGRLLDRVRGITLARNPANVGYPKGVNQAAAAARGDYLLFLNNDTEVVGRSIDAAADYFRTRPDAGIVGGKIVLLDGTLQEAGCVLWRDGWVDQHGRGGDPDDPQFGFERDVEHVSGAFLMTPRALFEELGGLDESYSPGYFEDVDYSVRVLRSGRRVVYLPDVLILHYENATHGGIIDVPKLALKHHVKFAAAHAEWLRHQPVRDPHRLHTLPFRSAADASAQVFVVADGSVPPGAIVACVRRVVAAEGFATVGLLGDASAAPELRAELPRTEIVPLANADSLRAYVVGRADTFDLALMMGNVDPTPLRSVGLAVVRWDGSRAVPLPAE